MGARANPLASFGEDELIEELARRRNARRADHPTRWCHDCVKCVPTAGKDDLRCTEGHSMIFHSPQDMDEANRGEYGYYRRVCADRTAKDDIDHE
jgi:hypothetical protein